MSWTVYINNRIEIRDVTYNNGTILRMLMIHPGSTPNKGLCASEWIPKFEEAERMLSDSEFLKDLENYNPKNGWGGIEDVKRFISLAKEKCEENPHGDFIWV